MTKPLAQTQRKMLEDMQAHLRVLSVCIENLHDRSARHERQIAELIRLERLMLERFDRALVVAAARHPVMGGEFLCSWSPLREKRH